MVDLKARPYYLSEEDCQWVKDTIANMSPEEKVGQLFFQLTASHDEEYLKELMEKYHLGGCRYNPAPGKAIQEQNRILQKYAKVPVFIACNTEAGGDGACADGTHIGAGVKIAATDKEEYAFALGKMANEQAAAIGCNMAFAPVADILYNWENTEIVTRAFGGDAERVATMSKAYLNGAHTIPGFACAAKHFPGNGQDFRDAHIANNVNYFDVEKCKRCLHKAGCYKDGAKTKTFSVNIKDDVHLKHMDYMASDELKKLYNERYKIEAKNGELKSQYGYGAANACGLLGITIQGASTLFLANMKRIIKLKQEKSKEIQ